MLFSEPKIPQSATSIFNPFVSVRFSALQRAENSSIAQLLTEARGRRLFQCSSASRKFLNSGRCTRRRRGKSQVSVLFSEPKIPQCARQQHLDAHRLSFSALQRAENSSIAGRRTAPGAGRRFQCSSASRKFLNGWSTSSSSSTS